MESLYEELAGLGEEERIRREIELKKRVGKHSRLLVDHLDHLHNLGVLEGIPEAVSLQASRKSYRAFELYERQALDPTPSSPEIDYGQGREEKPTDSIPLIRSSIVDMALLKIGLNPFGFADSVLDQLKVANKSMHDYFSVARHFVDLRSYLLTACLISHSFNEEFNLRGRALPAVARQLLRVKAQEIIERIKDSNKPLFEVAVRELEEVRLLLEAENAALSYGIDLARDVLGFDKQAVDTAVYHFYGGYRAQIDAEYWEKKTAIE